MKRRTPIAGSLAVLAAASLVLAACGGSSDSGESSASPTGSASPTATETSAGGEGPCKIGTMLPQTGNLAFLGPPEFAGVDLAVQEINAAGGVLGQPLENLPGDSGDTTTDIATQTADGHIAAGVTAIVGAASSSVSKTVIDKITSSGVIHFSPANTSPDFTNYPDNGLYFRTAPSDLFQGAVLAQVMLGEGLDNVGIMVFDDDYGKGLADALQSNVEANGGTVAARVTYNPQAAEFSADVTQMKSANPSAVALIGFDESVKIIQEMIKQGVGPDVLPLFLVDGNLSGSAYADLPEGIMTGTKGTLPGANAPEAFREQLLGVDPALEDFSYAAESYDAVNIIALAIVKAGTCDGTAVAAAIPEITRGPGDQCGNFADCVALINEGKDIDYQGVSGPIEMADNGDPTFATMGVYEYESNTKYVPSEFIEGAVPEPAS